jgi:hypothetical protein
MCSVQFSSAVEVDAPVNNHCYWSATPGFIEMVGIVYLKGKLICNNKKTSDDDVFCPEWEADDYRKCERDEDLATQVAYQNYKTNPRQNAESECHWISPHGQFHCVAAGKNYCYGYASCTIIPGRFTTCDADEAGGCNNVFRCAFLRTHVSDANACADEYSQSHPDDFSSSHQRGYSHPKSNP